MPGAPLTREHHPVPFSHFLAGLANTPMAVLHGLDQHTKYTISLVDKHGRYLMAV